MVKLGVVVPPMMRNPPRAYALIASAIWLAVSLPFLYLAHLSWNWPESVFADWRGWVYSSLAVACLLMATVVPPRYRITVVGTGLRGWRRLG